MGITPQSRDVTLYFDGDVITIARSKMSGIKKVPLANPQKIKRFAVMWSQLYRNHRTVPFHLFEDISYVGEGLSDLGFDMDCGESAKEKFPDINASKLPCLKRILDRIDLRTLGNLIYSNWRYWNHWATSPMTDEDFDWFVVAFERLAELARKELNESG